MNHSEWASYPGQEDEFTKLLRENPELLAMLSDYSVVGGRSDILNEQLARADALRSPQATTPAGAALGFGQSIIGSMQANAANAAKRQMMEDEKRMVAQYLGAMQGQGAMGAPPPMPMAIPMPSGEPIGGMSEEELAPWAQSRGQGFSEWLDQTTAPFEALLRALAQKG